MTAARRLVLHVHAATTDETRPHKSEEVYFWRYAPGRQVVELCERAVNLFFLSASDRNGMESLLVQVESDLKQHPTPVHVEAGKPLSECMIRRGEVSNGIFYGSSRPCSPSAAATLWPRCKRDGVETAWRCYRRASGYPWGRAGQARIRRRRNGGDGVNRPPENYSRRGGRRYRLCGTAPVRHWLL